MSNYDGSQVGVPYVRAHRVTINWADSESTPTAFIEQSEGVKLADGTIRTLGPLPNILVHLDFAGSGDAAIPLINPENAAHLGADTTLNQAFLAVLAVVRAEQLKAEPVAPV
jgi:hypothetical protein